jgi:O-antigen/teichoic acid export membrane protein
VTTLIRAKLPAVLEYGGVFVGDLLPYGLVFLMPLMVGYTKGLESAGSFSLAYSYVAIISAAVCGPNLLSLRRRMPHAESPGAVAMAAIGLRATVISVGALLLIVVLQSTGTSLDMMTLIAILFAGRLLETAVDGPAISVQYLRGGRAYFTLRLIVFVLMCGIIGLSMLSSHDSGLGWLAVCYLSGSMVGFFVAMASSHRLLLPVSGLVAEYHAQAADFGKFFVATALFLAASRLHPMIISLFCGHVAAGQFALVQNLFSALALIASGVAGVFFWSRNRKGRADSLTGLPWRWLAGALPGGLALGIVGGVLMDFLYLRPLSSSVELLTVAWILCLSTPLLLIQAILSNQLVLLKRDSEMLVLSAVSAIIGILLIALLVHALGLIGAALSVAASALLSSVLGIFVLHRTHE